MNFSHFLGNEKVKEQISFLLNSNRLPHAIILEGESGIGKRTLAREIAAALVCRSGGDKPCYACAQCQKAEKGYHPDIFEYKPKGGARSFHVETVRNVINDVYVAPNEADYKVYILCNAHFMNESAQNAILKVLEEPPSYAVFILTVENKSSMLETVLSRSVVLSLEGVDANSGAELIANKNEDIDFSAALEAVIAFKGNIGKAEESIAGGEMQKTIEFVNNICRALVADNEYELIKCTAKLSGRNEICTVLNLLKSVFRDAVIGSKTGEYLSGREDSVKALSRKFTDAMIIRLYNTADELIIMANKNANPALLATKICYSLRRAIDL
ncbi:MAG: hypothetical protein K2F65_01310 [Eubacterium sp.]|nr:hypothetical protein [Eubacterium sp.]